MLSLLSNLALNSTIEFYFIFNYQSVSPTNFQRKLLKDCQFVAKVVMSLRNHDAKMCHIKSQQKNTFYIVNLDLFVKLYA